MANESSSKSGDNQKQRGITSLDRAHGLRLAGDSEDALRLAASILTAAQDDLGAAALVARLLVEADRLKLAGEAGSRLVDAYIRRGDLASARVSAHIAAEAGQELEPLLWDIAAAFGRGSPRSGQVSPLPPPFPQDVEITPFFEKASGAGLCDKAEKALKRYLTSKDPVDADSTVPRLPLFGELEPPLLARLLEVQQLKELQAEQSLIEQGEEGREAFLLARGVANVVRQDSSGLVVLAALGPGAVFGEMALVSRAPRSASVVAVEPIQVLVMFRDDLEKLAEQEVAIARGLGKFCHKRLISNLIRHSSIMSAVHPARRKELIEGFQARTFEPGDLLVQQGQDASGLFIIASGLVQVSSVDADGESVVLAELGPGEVVGEIALVLRRPATADVTAIHPTVALELSSERFHDVVHDYPGLIGELYELAIKREAETRSVVAQQALEAEDVVIL